MMLRQNNEKPDLRQREKHSSNECLKNDDDSRYSNARKFEIIALQSFSLLLLFHYCPLYLRYTRHTILQCEKEVPT
jgi:hypothetical protein